MASTSQKAVFQGVVTDNNNGVVLIGNGNYKTAITKLVDALKTSTQLVRCYSDCQYDYFQSNEGGNKERTFDQYMVASSKRKLRSSIGNAQQAKPSPLSSRGQGGYCGDNDPVHPYLYSHAIHIPSDVTESQNIQVMVSSIIMFNLALAYHRLSMNNNKAGEDGTTNAATTIGNNKLLLSKAMKLYKYGLEMHSMEPFDDNILFTLATLNNIGHAHSLLKNKEDADQSFQKLLSILMYLVSIEFEAVKQNGYDFDGFFQNASASQCQPNTASAA